MAEKRTGVSFTPSASQDGAKWAAARAKRLALLRNSDWTQLRDVYTNLTPEVRLAWDMWRQALRALNAKAFPTPEEFDTAIDALRLHVPSTFSVEALTPEVAPPPAATPTPPSSTYSAEEIVSLAEDATRAITRRLGINALTFADLFSQATDGMLEMRYHDNFDSSRFPMVKAIADATGEPFNTVVNRIVKSYTSLATHSARVEAAMHQALAGRQQPDADLQEVWGNYTDAITAVLDTLDA